MTERGNGSMAGSYQEAEQNNQMLWDEIAGVHFRAYESVQTLRNGGIALEEAELEEVGPVQGKTLLHLQCHIGTDTLSWARLGARVTGVDFSAQSLRYARQLRDELSLQATFLQSNIFDLPAVLAGEFDIVYTSRGVLCWLRDLEAWGQIIAHFLAPGGTFFLLESHPFLHMLEELPSGELSLAYPYFHGPEPTCWDDASGDYADPTYVPQHPSYEWDWSIGDILGALLEAGLTIESFREYDRLFDPCFPSMVPDGQGGWIHPRYPGRLPWAFSLRARKGVYCPETPPRAWASIS